MDNIMLLCIMFTSICLYCCCSWSFDKGSVRARLTFVNHCLSVHKSVIGKLCYTCKRH